MNLPYMVYSNHQGIKIISLLLDHSTSLQVIYKQIKNLKKPETTTDKTSSKDVGLAYPIIELSLS